jgi:hypothetical protein
MGCGCSMSRGQSRGGELGHACYDAKCLMLCTALLCMAQKSSISLCLVKQHPAAVQNNTCGWMDICTLP